MPYIKTIEGLEIFDKDWGTPLSAFDEIRRNVEADRSQYWMDLSAPFYGANREGNKISHGLREQFWRLGMQMGLKPGYDCVKACPFTSIRTSSRRATAPATRCCSPGRARDQRGERDARQWLMTRR